MKCLLCQKEAKLYTSSYYEDDIRIYECHCIDYHGQPGVELIANYFTSKVLLVRVYTEKFHIEVNYADDQYFDPKVGQALISTKQDRLYLSSDIFKLSNISPISFQDLENKISLLFTFS